MSKISEIEFDAVVVGGGGAGLRAALQLSGAGRNVALVSKVFPTRSHTVSAQGGINAAIAKNDDWRWHMYDTVMGSDCMGDQDSIEFMCREAPRSVLELEHMGLPFSRLEDGHIYQRAFGGQTLDFGKGGIAHRTCAAADRTGHAMLHTLFQQNVKAKTQFYHEWFAIDLVKSAHGHIGGIIAMSIETGELVFMKTPATILATGGAGRIFASTTNALINSGDGLGMVLRAGLPLQDMEMWQFHPTGIYGSGTLITEGSRGEGGYLLNQHGERYMERYSPNLKDLDCRDVVARSSMIEIREGRGCGPKKDHVLLKLDHLGEAIINERLPGIRELAMKFAGVDLLKQPIPVVPTCHYLMGGIPTNFYGQVLTVDQQGTDQIVNGLYACGECACVSVHGANRLGANSLLDIIVFGRASGMHVADALRQGLSMPTVSPDDIELALSRVQRWERAENTENPNEIRQEMKLIMQNSFGVFRDAGAMAEGVEKLRVLIKRVERAKLDDKSQVFNTNRIECLELDNLLEVALVTALQANHRTESRGAHCRFDFPERDDVNWLKHVAVFLDGRLQDRPVNMQPNEVAPIPVKLREH